MRKFWRYIATGKLFQEKTKTAKKKTSYPPPPKKIKNNNKKILSPSFSALKIETKQCPLIFLLNAMNFWSTESGTSKISALKKCLKSVLLKYTELNEKSAGGLRALTFVSIFSALKLGLELIRILEKILHKSCGSSKFWWFTFRYGWASRHGDAQQLFPRVNILEDEYSSFPLYSILLRPAARSACFQVSLSPKRTYLLSSKGGFLKSMHEVPTQEVWFPPCQIWWG